MLPNGLGGPAVMRPPVPMLNDWLRAVEPYVSRATRALPAAMSRLACDA